MKQLFYHGHPCGIAQRPELINQILIHVSKLLTPEQAVKLLISEDNFSNCGSTCFEAS